MKTRKAILPLILVLSLLCSCSAMFVPVHSLKPIPPSSALRPDPVTPPDPEPVELEKVTANGLVLRLLESECSLRDGKNVILSPLSIEMALGMAANGADGKALEDIRTLLGMDPAQLNALLGAYLRKEDSTLSIANAMWFNGSLTDLVRPVFKDTLARSYAAGEGTFTPYSTAAADEINAWVRDKTRGKINDIVSSDSLSDDTLGLLINALYFNGKWIDPFESWQVEEGTFRAPDGDRQAQFMCQWLDRYYETDLAVGFSKQYDDGYEFVAILPRDETMSLSHLLAALDADAFLDSCTRIYDVDIKLPKFELEYAASLVQTLTRLGLGSLFEDGALNAMLTEDALSADWEAHVSDVIHKTYMKMYEEGTEAAAVTAVMVECTAMAPAPRETRQVYLDRPFAFLIRDCASGQAVFCGAISDVG